MFLRKLNNANGIVYLMIVNVNVPEPQSRHFAVEIKIVCFTQRIAIIIIIIMYRY